MAKRKLNLILKSKSNTVIPVRIGDLVQVFIKIQNEKRENGPELSQFYLMTSNQAQ